MMEALKLREQLINNIQTLPFDIVQEINDFTEFLLIKKSMQEDSKEYILDSLNEVAIEMRDMLQGKV
ncbi:MAG: DUF2281 domain-containing protein [Campylobacterales bacterium]|nr:DUF2281 domain-containing protein [Campylobacterales bacterium]